MSARKFKRVCSVLCLLMHTPAFEHTQKSKSCAVMCLCLPGSLSIPKLGISYDGMFKDGKPLQMPTKMNLFW